jgi:hypothetical protein
MGAVAETYVIPILGHKDIFTRVDACKLLGEIGAAAANEPLRARTAQGEDTLVKRAAEDALKKIAARGGK